MANLVVSELLCFLRCKMASVPAQNLIQVCKAFFSDEEIAKAKERLFESEVEWTSVGVRNIKRKTTIKASKASLDLEDMMKALQAADGACLDLPVFVAQDLNRVPSVSPESVDLCVLAEEIRTLNKKVSEIESRTSVALDNKDTKKTYASAASRPSEPQRSAMSHVRREKEISLQNDSASDGKDKSSGSGSEWVKVSRSKSERAHRGVIGVKSTATSGLRGVPKPARMREYYIGRLDCATKKEDLMDYLSETGICVKECEDLKTGHNYFASFRISCSEEVEKSLFQVDLWPQGVLIRRFYRKREQNSGSSKSSFAVEVGHVDCGSVSTDNNG